MEIVRIGVFTTVSSVSVTNEKWPSKIDSGECATPETASQLEKAETKPVRPIKVQVTRAHDRNYFAAEVRFGLRPGVLIGAKKSIFRLASSMLGSSRDDVAGLFRLAGVAACLPAAAAESEGSYIGRGQGYFSNGCLVHATRGLIRALIGHDVACDVHTSVRAYGIDTNALARVASRSSRRFRSLAGSVGQSASCVAPFH